MASVHFNEYWHLVADAGLELLRSRFQSAKEPSQNLYVLCEELLSNQGEASGIALAMNIVEQLRSLDDESRLAFFESIYSKFDVDHQTVLTAAEDFCRNQDQKTLRRLIQGTEPRRQELFRRINMAPGGTRAIVELRSELLKVRTDHKHLGVIDLDLKHLLSSWFNRGFLTLEQINWETPAVVLEKLIEYETVHEMKGWEDLRGRLADDRRCFAFFHPTLPNEPLIFVEVALVKGLSDSIRPIIDTDRPVDNPKLADTAIFYSINNCQTGLRGVSFGNFLIKQVVQKLAQELPNLKNFATLSPIPGFSNWFDLALDQPQRFGITSRDSNALLGFLADGGFTNRKPPESLKPIFFRLAAYYLAFEKHKDKPLDPVARFHLRNGASLKRINWHADDSVKGLSQSAGILANYVYSPNTIVQNHENYVQGKKLAISKDIIDLVPKKLRNLSAKNNAAVLKR